MSQYFPKPYRAFGRNAKVELDLSSYATKADLKNATGINTSNFTLISNFASLKAEVHKIDVDKLKIVLADLSKLSNVVNNDVVKKIVYDKLVTEVHDIDTSGFVLKTKHNTDKSELVNKISNTSELVKKVGCNAKISEIEGKIPSISSLAMMSALTAVENKIPSISTLVKKTDYNTKISEIEKKITDHNHDKYFTTLEFNNLAAAVSDARLKQVTLVTKTDFDTKVRIVNQKINSNKTKH